MEPILITSTEYMLLDDPRIVGQSRADQEGNYTMTFEVNGQHYIINKNLFL